MSPDSVVSDRVTVVIPTYNECENLADLAAAVRAYGYRLLVVDDNSPDGTGDLADGLAAEDEAIAVLHRPAKRGLGKAYTEAFDRLIASEEADVIVEMDADFSHDPVDLPRLIAAIEAGADLVIGSRYVAGGSTPDWPLTRRLVSKGGNLYARLMLGVPTRDTTAGFRAFRVEALRRLPYDQTRASGYGFQVEMAWLAHRTGLTIAEVPVNFRDRTRGTSKMGTKIVLEAMWLVTVWGLSRLGRSIRLTGR